jgi:hypothetical protein
MMICDFHVHSQFSDGKMSIPELIDFYGSRGFGAIAITDHICESNSFFGFAAGYLEYTLTSLNFSKYMQTLEEQAERAWFQYRMVVIPGFELTKNSWSNHRSAHILALGVSDFISADGDILSLMSEIKAQGALTIAAHPVSTQKLEKQTYHLWSRREELAPFVDAWEVASGPHVFHEVLRTNLPKIANSDLHHAKQISSWKTILSCERHPQAILEAIKKQDVRFQFYEDPNRNQTRFSGSGDLLFRNLGLSVN